MLVKKFFIFLTVVITFFLLLITTSEYSHTRETQIKNLTSLTKLPGLALSTPYLEQRVIYYSDDSSRLYPLMKNYLRMDYVYAK